MHGPYRARFPFSAVRCESDEVVLAFEHAGRRPKVTEIQRRRDVPDSAHFEWWQNRSRPYSITIRFCYRGKARVEFIRNIACAQNTNLRRKKRVQCALPVVRRAPTLR